MKYNEIKSILLNEQKVWLITGVAGFIGSNLAEALLTKPKGYLFR